MGKSLQNYLDLKSEVKLKHINSMNKLVDIQVINHNNSEPQYREVYCGGCEQVTCQLQHCPSVPDFTGYYQEKYPNDKVSYKGYLAKGNRPMFRIAIEKQR